VLLLNGNLEDAAIGHRQCGRQRRRGFPLHLELRLLPLIPRRGSPAASFPIPRPLNRRMLDGYRWVANFEQKPRSELQAEALKPGQTPHGRC